MSFFWEKGWDLGTRKKPSIQDQVQTVSFKQNTDNNKKIASF